MPITFNLNLFIDGHPKIFVLLALVGIALITFLVFAICFKIFPAIYKLISTLIHKGVKIGNAVDIKPDEEEKIKKVADQELQVQQKQLIMTTIQIVNTTVDNTFKKSIKRQELYNRQVSETEQRFNSIISSITVNYLKSEKAYIMKYVDIVLHMIFEETIYKPLKIVYKADKLLEKSEDELIEQQRTFINAAGIDVLKKSSEVLAADPSLEGLRQDIIKYIEGEQENIKKTVIDCLKKAYNLAKDEMMEIQKLQGELNDNIGNILYTQFNEKRTDFPQNWNDDLPPNDIIGEIN
jgi:hypothetical protein